MYTGLHRRAAGTTLPDVSDEGIDAFRSCAPGYNLAMDDPVDLRIEPDAARKLVRLTRTPTPMPAAMADVRAAFLALAPALRAYAGQRVLLDLRLGPAPQRSRVRAALRKLRVSILSRLERIAIRVRSAAGRLHVRRLSEGEGEIFFDEQEALRYRRRRERPRRREAGVAALVRRPRTSSSGGIVKLIPPRRAFSAS